ncbi:colicin E3/pyocin S6 family cytotoxin [Rhodococcoides navarretei]|uniref:Colicin E3/pyocin S6 family cytotoxin n=1 Tax=Rhodococcus navarretei TaxID=3128981 RepID=A0ABU9D007_9NOCA
MNGRKRWVDDKGNIYEWDYQHGAVEKYSKSGKHLGEYDPNTGAQTSLQNPAESQENKCGA